MINKCNDKPQTVVYKLEIMKWQVPTVDKTKNKFGVPEMVNKVPMSKLKFSRFRVSMVDGSVETQGMPEGSIQNVMNVTQIQS